MAMNDLIKIQLASQMSFDDLSPDLQEKVNIAREVANPKFRPAEIAHATSESTPQPQSTSTGSRVNFRDNDSFDNVVMRSLLVIQLSFSVKLVRVKPIWL